MSYKATILKVPHIHNQTQPENFFHFSLEGILSVVLFMSLLLLLGRACCPKFYETQYIGGKFAENTVYNVSVVHINDLANHIFLGRK